MIEKMICKLGQYFTLESDETNSVASQHKKHYDFNVDLLGTNILIAGTKKSGKTNLIRLLINTLHKKMDTLTEQIFILDFGNDLFECKKMSLVRAYFNKSSDNFIENWFKILELNKNQSKHTTIFIDNFDTFLGISEYSSYHNKIFNILSNKDLLKKISIVVSISNIQKTVMYMDNFTQKVALNLSMEEHLTLFRQELKDSDNISGHGWANIYDAEKQTNNIYEVHCSSYMTKEIICKLGRYDIPVLQQQRDFNVDLLKSNVISFGATQSGKTNLIRLIINILHKKMNVNTEQIFILDFGGALSEYQNMPLVSAYFDNSNEEYVKRVFKILEGKLKENTSKLGGVGFSKKFDGNQPKHITFFIDNFNAFLDEPRYSGYQEKFARLCRDGLSKGISIIITASDTKGTTAYLNNFTQKIAISLPDDRYAEIFGRKVTSIGNIPGRGFANVTLKFTDITGTFDMNAPYEVHCSFAETLDSEKFIGGLYDKFGMPDEQGNFPDSVEKYKKFPTELGMNEYYELLGSEDDGTSEKDYCVSVGLDYVDFKPVICDFEQSRFLGVYAKREFGREELIERLVKVLMAKRKSNVKLVLFDDGRELLSDIYKKYPTSTYISKYKMIKMPSVVEPERKISQIHPERGNAARNFIGNVPREQINAEPNNVENIPNSERKLSPMQQFIKYIHEECMDLGNYIGPLYTGKPIVTRERSGEIPIGCIDIGKNSTIFVIQSKLAFSTVKENKVLMEHILPMLADIAEERDYIFIFSDVKKIADNDMNEKFNSIIKSLFILDNIAEFVSERGQKTLLGDMDVKTLKSDYAKCELGDGYFYDVEADKLKKLKFIQEVE